MNASIWVVIVFISGLIMQIQPMGWLSYWVLSKWFTKIGQEKQLIGLNKIEGLSNGNRTAVSVYIGILERLIIFTFIWNGAYEATSFVIAGKALLRFREANEERHSEYILVGTLLSSAIAILSAEGLKALCSLLG